MGKRNERFNVGTDVVLMFNPKYSLNIGTLYSGVSVPDIDGEVTISWQSLTTIDLLTSGDAFVTPILGGRIINPQVGAGQIDFGITADALNGKQADYIPLFYRTRAWIFNMLQDTNHQYWYCVNSIGKVAIPTAANDNANKTITAKVFKRGFKDLSTRYGWKGLAYSNRFEETITFSIPPETPQWKLQQLLASTAVAVVGENTLTTTQTDTPYYNYFYQGDAGSLNPMIRMIRLNTNSLNFNSRRNQFEIEAVMLG